jgi:hypothetical protein
MIIDEILKLSKELLAFRDSFKKAKKERREELAKYFENISNCLDTVAKELRAGNIPHGKCGEMLGYSWQFEETVKGIISKAQAKDFAERLGKNYDVEKAELDLYDAQKRSAQIDKIEESSGYFRALANSTRAR